MPRVYLNWVEAKVSTLPRVTGVRIVCGDCGLRDEAADDDKKTVLPRQTFMNVRGQCSRCGGRSFVLAAELAPVLARTIKGEPRTETTETTGDLPPARASENAQPDALIN